MTPWAGAHQTPSPRGEVSSFFPSRPLPYLLLRLHVPSAACEHSAVFAAVLYCNWVAAYQGQQQWVHAVVDWCRAKALDPGHAMAHSRLAALLSGQKCSAHRFSTQAELVPDCVCPQSCAGRHDEAAAKLEAVLKLPGLSPDSKSSYEPHTLLFYQCSPEIMSSYLCHRPVSQPPPHTPSLCGIRQPSGNGL